MTTQHPDAGMFPRMFEGEMRSAPAISKLSGLSRWDISLAIKADPTIVTLGALITEVRKIKSTPRPKYHPCKASMVQVIGKNSIAFHRKANSTINTKAKRK